MPLNDRDYMKGSHPPSCTCVECTNRRLRKWQGSAKSRKNAKPRGTPSGCILSLLVVFILLLFGFVVWSLWGNQIVSFLNNLSTSITRPVTEPLPLNPPPAEPAPAPAPVQPTPAPTPLIPERPPHTNNTKVNYTNEDVEENIYLLINMVRQRYGLNPLKKDSLLIGLASEHSISMIEHGFFGHDRAAKERDLGYGQHPGTLRGENIFKVPKRQIIPGPYLTLEDLCEWVVSGWMDSTGHRKNILEPVFTETGVGVSDIGEYLYITQMFEGAY